MNSSIWKWVYPAACLVLAVIAVVELRSNRWRLTSIEHVETASPGANPHSGERPVQNQASVETAKQIARDRNVKRVSTGYRSNVWTKTHPAPVRAQPIHPLARNAVQSPSQDVDHFSDDARAMSPRSWGNYHGAAEPEPQAPAVSFDQPRQRRFERGNLKPENPDRNRFEQVENSKLLEPKPFYETQPLQADPGNSSSPFASPVPGIDRQSEDRSLNNSSADETDRLESRLDSPPDPHPTVRDSELHSPSRLDDPVGDPAVLQPSKQPTTPGLLLGPPVAPWAWGDSSHGSCACGSHDCVRMPAGGDQSRCQRCGKSRRSRRAKTNQPESWGCDCTLPPKYNEALGHRSPCPVLRGFQGSSTETFSFEEDIHFPPVSEILANSIFFAEADFMFLQGAFQGNTAVTSYQPGSSTSRPFNFDLEPAFQVIAGYQSNYGPGFAAEYFQFDNNSDFLTFTSDGVVTGETRVYQLGPNTWTSVFADDAGESIQSLHSLEVHSISAHAFKALQFKRASVTGRFGFQLVSIDQKLEARLLNSCGILACQLTSISELDALGPRFGIDYVRRVGHTPLQLLTSATTSLLFGDRDQTVFNTTTNLSNSIGADEFVTAIDIYLGLQYKRYRGEKQNTAFRVGFVNQTWLGGGTGIDPNGDFGFQGVSFSAGFNR